MPNFELGQLVTEVFDFIFSITDKFRLFNMSFVFFRINIIFKQINPISAADLYAIFFEHRISIGSRRY